MNGPDDPVRLDLNNPEFQDAWFALEKQAQLQVLRTLQQLRRMRWQEVYGHRGLRWELIHSRQVPGGIRLYSFRISQGFRGVAFREGSFMRIVSLHPDHDSAYE